MRRVVANVEQLIGWEIWEFVYGSICIDDILRHHYRTDLSIANYYYMLKACRHCRDMYETLRCYMIEGINYIQSTIVTVRTERIQQDLFLGTNKQVVIYEIRFSIKKLLGQEETNTTPKWKKNNMYDMTRTRSSSATEDLLTEITSTK